MKDMEEIIAAFVDDERVDADALGRALSLPEGRQYLLDLLALREMVVDRVNASSVVTPAVTSRVLSKPWLTAAAALLLSAAAMAGFRVGRQMADAPSREVIEQPVASPSVATSGPQAAKLVTAPAPTRIIQLERGKDWEDKIGGE